MRTLKSFTAAALMFGSFSTLASDLQIYQDAQAGDNVLTLMVDRSGSMADYDAPCVSYENGDLSRPFFNSLGGRFTNASDDPDYAQYNWSFGYVVCNGSNVKQARRIDDLKMAIFDVLDDPEMPQETVIALGAYPNNDVTQQSQGNILVPASKLTSAGHKSAIKQVVSNLRAAGGTPLAPAYAEATAYMLGSTTLPTNTQDPIITTLWFVENRSGTTSERLYRCDKSDTSSVQADGNRWFGCANPVSIGFGSCAAIENYINNRGGWTRTTGERRTNCEYRSDYRYGEIQDQASADDQYSGTKNSVGTSKTGPIYNSPINTSQTQCNGNGIYLLTDGEPNLFSYSGSVSREDNAPSIVKRLMNKALGQDEVNCDSSNYSNNGVGGTSAAWKCSGDLAKVLEGSKNSRDLKIKTATVGFGSVYRSLTNPAGIDACNAASSPDAQNLCRLGFDGDGGFYYADDKKAIVQSIIDFASGLGGTIDPLTTGAFATPVDPVDRARGRSFVYLPVVGPKPGQNSIWPGNLKKYSIADRTIQGAGGGRVFSDSNGTFNPGIYDFWNASKSADGALPQTGGAFSQILVTDNISAESSKPTRHAYTEQSESLVSVSVKGNKPVGFTRLSGFANGMKIALLNFMGYPVPEGFNGLEAITDTTTLSDDDTSYEFDASIKRLGGVFNSVPQLITKSAQVDGDGQIDSESREDYLLYGSMDGALHVIDDQSGHEVFTFVPREILTTQGELMINRERVLKNRFPYGVDGLWNIYSTFKNVTGGVVSKQIIASGGLGLGGSAHYSLNLTDLDDPEMVYKAGSNYAELLSGSTLSDVPAALAGSPSEFKRMGLTWGQPSSGFVRVDGKRALVNFLPGGYDLCYEKASFKVSGSTANGLTCDTKSNAMGNAVYMMGIGSVEVDSEGEDNPDATNDTTVNTEAPGISDNLLWWTSADAGISGTSNSDLKHSIVSEVRTFDRNYDGYTDHIYFADLGGQVFRVDIKNDAENDFEVERVVRLFDGSSVKAGANPSMRFYEKPLVSFVRLGQSITGVVTLGSGDRSNPLSKGDTPDYLISFLDRDVARRDLFDPQENLTLNTEDIGFSTNTEIEAEKLNELQLKVTEAQALKAAMINTTSNGVSAPGWYLPITQFDSTDGVKGLKVFNQPDVLSGFLFYNVYNPNEEEDINTCQPRVIGKTERQLMCVPFGICNIDDPELNDGDIKTIASQFGGKGIADTFVISVPKAGSGSGSGARGGAYEIAILDPFCTGDDCKTIVPEDSCVGADCFRKGFPGDRDLKPLEWLLKQ